MKSFSIGARQRLRLVVVPVLVAALAACSLNEKIDEMNRIEYKSAAKLPPLDVPPDLSAPAPDGRYTVPDRATDARTASERSRTATGAAAASAAQPAGVPAAGSGTVLPGVKGARIERGGSQRWLVVDQPPERVWPVVRNFWHESGFTVQSESPDTGIIETEWAENRAKLPLDFIRRTLGRVLDSVYSTGERDKFRTRLEPAGAGTEIYISHRGMVEVYTSEAKDTTVWQPRPSDPDLEAEFLRRLMLKFADTDTQQVAGVETSASERARLIDSDAAQVLEVNEGFDRAWRRVGLALDRGGFTVEDRDRAEGMYFVRYIDPEVEGGRVAQKPGILTRLFGGSKSRADASQQFRVRVEERGSEQSRVTVLGADGKPVGEVDRRTAGRILALLHEQLK